MKASACALLLLLCPAATLAEPETILQDAAQNPVLIEAIAQQNRQYEDATSFELMKLDTRWQAETAAMKRPLIEGVLYSPTSQYLKKLADEHQVKDMIYVTDQRGLLVAATTMTYRYIMDDSSLWRQAFLADKNQVLRNAAEDPGYMVLSRGVRDPKTGDVIGVISIITSNAGTPPPTQHAATTETDPPAEWPDS